MELIFRCPKCHTTMERESFNCLSKAEVFICPNCKTKVKISFKGNSIVMYIDSVK